MSEELKYLIVWLVAGLIFLFMIGFGIGSGEAARVQHEKEMIQFCVKNDRDVKYDDTLVIGCEAKK